MTQEDKELLLKDLCARLPYGVICHYDCAVPSVGKVINYDRLNGIVPIQDTIGFMVGVHSINALFDNIKPYLRPMSSMTDEECMELSKIRPFDDDVEAWKYVKTPVPLTIANIKHFDFFHSHHLDWRGLIKKGLALEAPEGMYN